MIKEFIKHLEDVKVKDIKIYDLSTQSPFYEYFVICSCNGPQAMAVISRVKNDSILCDAYIEGQNTDWVLIEKSGVVVHLFVGATREEYNFDKNLQQFLIH